MKKILAIIIFLTVSTTAYAITIEDLAGIARILNTQLPTMGDDLTRIDKVTIGPGKRINYHYTVLFTHASIQKNELSRVMRPIVMDNICNGNETMKWVSDGVVYQFEYTGTDGILIDVFSVGVNDCLKNN
jgi:hypothetical protein